MTELRNNDLLLEMWSIPSTWSLNLGIVTLGYNGSLISTLLVLFLYLDMHDIERPVCFVSHVDPVLEEFGHPGHRIAVLQLQVGPVIDSKLPPDDGHNI